MKPLQLTMQAFGSYGKMTRIDFTVPQQPLFLITGDTGSGKSTIFDAIVFALYGEAASFDSRKDTIWMQSQYAHYDLEPYVELTFSQGHGESEKVYTVKRVPRHLRPLRRGKGVKEESASVLLTMPDGSFHPVRETDEKIEEIIGLTKGQFMQVAMIAQGEFMALLRAKSEEKKVIFRKLFHTWQFQDIVEELQRRRREKQDEIDQLSAAGRTLAAQIVVPDEAPEADELKTLRDELAGQKQWSVSTQEKLELGLDELCRYLKARTREQKLQVEALQETCDHVREELARAEHVLRFFAQMEQAREELAQCEARQAEITEKIRLIEGYRMAKDIYPVYQRYADAAQRLEKSARALEAERQSYPQKMELAASDARKETEKKRILDEALEHCTRIKERAGRALAALEKAEQAAQEMRIQEKKVQEAQKKTEELRRWIADLEEKRKTYSQAASENADADAQLARCDASLKEAGALLEETGIAMALRTEEEKAEGEAERKRAAYERSTADYTRIREEYERSRRLFLDEQAGLLARNLKDDEPCPVCGSRHHPHPHALGEEMAAVTREGLDALEKKVSRLGAEQEKASAAVQLAAAAWQEKTQTVRQAQARLAEHLRDRFADLPEDFSPDDLPAVVLEKAKGLGQRLKEEKQRQEKRAQKYRRAQELMNGAMDAQREKREQLEASLGALQEERAALEHRRSYLLSLETDRDYRTKEEARSAISSAEHALEAAKGDHLASRKKAAVSKAAADESLILQERAEKELPGLKDLLDQYGEAYRQAMALRGTKEETWKRYLAEYTDLQIQAMAENVEEFRTKRESAQRLHASARQSVEGLEKPQMAPLQQKLEEKGQELADARQVLGQHQEWLQIDLRIQDAMKHQLKDRSRVLKEWQKINELYQVLGGKMTGSRMDIETYVQRYYLERILHSANIRFKEMTLGQFELRMYSQEKAGEGKNRGLDLMVYSQVTGKEREIYTLSGGESFMAALSLALGMADQIRQNRAVLGLDMLFIDEGFGSLDDHSRSQAVRVLQEMAGGSRLIGIISHVSELKQEIEDQLQVTRDETGSHVRWLT